MGTKAVRFIVVFFTIAMLSACGGGGGGDGTSVTTPEIAVSGVLAQGYVSGATVFADKVASGQDIGNMIKDEGEIGATSIGNGSFSFTVPENYGNYVVVSVGGWIEDKDADGNVISERPASPMMAPQKSETNGVVKYTLTPVTTIVAFNPGLKNLIGDDYDADIASGDGVPAIIMMIAQMVESTARLLAENDDDLNDAMQKNATPEKAMAMFNRVFKIISDEIKSKAEKENKSKLEVSDIQNMNDVVTHVVSSVLSSGNIIDSITNAISTITQALNTTGKTTEHQIIEMINHKVAETVQNIKVTQVTGENDQDSISPIAIPDNQIQLNIAEQINRVKVQFELNNFNQIATEYTGHIVVRVKQKNSNRLAEMKVTHVNFSIDATGSLTLSGSNTLSRIIALGIKADGTSVSIDSVLSDEVVFEDGAVTFDLEKLNNLSGSGQSLTIFNKTGDYELTVDILGQASWRFISPFTKSITEIIP